MPPETFGFFAAAVVRRLLGDAACQNTGVASRSDTLFTRLCRAPRKMTTNGITGAARSVRARDERPSAPSRRDDGDLCGVPGGRDADGPSPPHGGGRPADANGGRVGVLPGEEHA